MKPEQVLIRPVDAAAMLSVSRSSVYELIANGTIPSVRVGRMLRVPIAAIRKLAGQTERPNEDAR